MIRNLKCFNHKAIKQVYFNELGKLNILCGKNNSGKTSIFEALVDEKTYGIGKQVEDLDWLMKLIEDQFTRYTDPNPNNVKDWFRSFLNEEISNNSVWYSDESEIILKKIEATRSINSYMKRWGKDIFTYKPFLDRFFIKTKEFYKPILIPPKRRLNSLVKIDLAESVSPNGGGIVNKLFFLKNQDLESVEYKTYLNIYNTFNQVTKLKFNVVPGINNEIILKFSTDNKEWISADSSGLGLSDVLVIISVVFITESNFIFIEEPENHLHAEYQKNLLLFLKKIKGKQFFLSTHSAIFLDVYSVDKIFYCKNEREIIVSDQTSKSEIINSLGYSVSENLVSDVIILTEGPTDIPVIKKILHWLNVLDNYNIKFWALGGDIMAELDLTVFAERTNVFALIDNDPGSSVQRTRFERNCKEINLPCCRLSKYSIENYFTIDSLKKVFLDQIPTTITALAPNENVDTQLGFKEKGRSIKGYNYKIVSEMTIEDLQGTDLLEFIITIKDFLLNQRHIYDEEVL